MSKWSKENIVKVVVGLTVVAAAGWAGVLWTEAWSVGTYGAYVIALGLLGGIVWAAWRLGSRRTKKVGVAMAALVAVGGLLIVTLGAPEVCADGGCANEACVRDLPCLVTCPPCNGSPFDPGTCWYAMH